MSIWIFFEPGENGRASGDADREAGADSIITCNHASRYWLHRCVHASMPSHSGRRRIGPEPIKSRSEPENPLGRRVSRSRRDASGPRIDDAARYKDGTPRRRHEQSRLLDPIRIAIDLGL